eukprot:scaffold4052_cov126-Isochrysis_galbana.AAC.1
MHDIRDIAFTYRIAGLPTWSSLAVVRTCPRLARFEPISTDVEVYGVNKHTPTRPTPPGTTHGRSYLPLSINGTKQSHTHSRLRLQTARAPRSKAVSRSAARVLPHNR